MKGIMVLEYQWSIRSPPIMLLPRLTDSILSRDDESARYLDRLIQIKIEM